VQVAAGSVVMFNVLPWTRPPDDVHVAKWDSRDIVMVAGITCLA
jgi:hypothetical protein